MSYVKLTEEHPTTKKIRELEHIMDEMGLSVGVTFDQQLTIHDRETGETLWYMDSELSVGGYESTSDFPCPFETKLVKEK